MIIDKDPREDKLPAWARALLAKERSARRSAEEDLADHRASEKKTRIWYGDWDNHVYIPEHYGYQRVHFDLGSNEDNRDDVNIGIDKGNPHKLLINCGRAIVIKPWVTNEIQLFLEPDA